MCMTPSPKFHFVFLAGGLFLLQRLLDNPPILGIECLQIDYPMRKNTHKLTSK